MEVVTPVIRVTSPQLPILQGHLKGLFTPINGLIDGYHWGETNLLIGDVSHNLCLVFGPIL